MKYTVLCGIGLVLLYLIMTGSFAPGGFFLGGYFGASIELLRSN